MKPVGIIVEYNPFHNGHLFHLHQAKKEAGADVVVAVMSGNFTQRGEPTIVDKWARTRAALSNGVDLVVELPLFYAVQPAHRFAAGAMKLLSSLGVQSIAFGAEHPELDFKKLVEAEKNFNHDAFNKYNATYATQFNQQLKAQTGISLIDPNDILAFAYTKANLLNNYQMNLLPIKRQGSNYHDEKITGKISSATAIREAIHAGNNQYMQAIPVAMQKELANLSCVPSWEQMYPLLRNQLIQAPVKYLAATYMMAEGLEYRMKEATQRSLNFNDFMKRCKTKRYTYAHLLRVSLFTLLQISQLEQAEHEAKPYLHVLGFTQAGKQYLHSIKKDVDLPLITKVDQDLRDNSLNLDYRAGKLYQLFTSTEQDLKHPPVIMN